MSVSGGKGSWAELPGIGPPVGTPAAADVLVPAELGSMNISDGKGSWAELPGIGPPVGTSAADAAAVALTSDASDDVGVKRRDLGGVSAVKSIVQGSSRPRTVPREGAAAAGVAGASGSFRDGSLNGRPRSIDPGDIGREGSGKGSFQPGGSGIRNAGKPLGLCHPSQAEAQSSGL